MTNETIEVGPHQEMALIDFMADGSTVANLIFQLGIHNLLVARRAHVSTILRSHADCLVTGYDVKVKVLTTAAKLVKDEDKRAAYDVALENSLDEETL